MTTEGILDIVLDKEGHGVTGSGPGGRLRYDGNDSDTEEGGGSQTPSAGLCFRCVNFMLSMYSTMYLGTNILLVQLDFES